MPTKLAINGFGRIGRLVLRTLLQRHPKDFTVVAVNDMADLKTNAHLFRYDSTYGIYPGKVESGAGVSPVPYVEAVRRSYAPESWRATRA